MGNESDVPGLAEYELHIGDVINERWKLRSEVSEKSC